MWIHLEAFSKVSSSFPKIYNSQLHIIVLYITFPTYPLNVKDEETQLFHFALLFARVVRLDVYRSILLLHISQSISLGRIRKQYPNSYISL